MAAQLEPVVNHELTPVVGTPKIKREQYQNEPRKEEPKEFFNPYPQPKPVQRPPVSRPLEPDSPCSFVISVNP